MRVIGTMFVKVWYWSAGKGRKGLIFGGKKTRQKLRFLRWILDGTVKVVKAKSAKLQGVRVRARTRAPFFPSFCCDFQPSTPSPLSLPFESIKITVSTSKYSKYFLENYSITPKVHYNPPETLLPSSKKPLPSSEIFSPTKHKKRRR